MGLSRITIGVRLLDGVVRHIEDRAVVRRLPNALERCMSQLPVACPGAELDLGEFQRKEESPPFVPASRLMVNDTGALVGACLSGAGIAQLLELYARTFWLMGD